MQFDHKEKKNKKIEEMKKNKEHNKFRGNK